MVDLNKGFYIESRGNWPEETYFIYPSATFINPNLGFLPSNNYFRFLYNTINEADSLNTVSYTNATYSFREESGHYSIDFNKNSSINWNLSATRKNYLLPPQFNFLCVNTNPGADINYRKYYAYSLYPSRLFLKPLSLTKESDGWSLSTSTVVSPATSFFYYSATPEADAEKKHIEYLNNPYQFVSLPNSANFSIAYSLSATRRQIDRPLFYFSDSYNPVYYSSVLETDLFNPELPVNGVIRFDSPVVTYNVKYYRTTYIPNDLDVEEDHVINLSQNLADVDADFTNNFVSTYILNYDNLNLNELIFQMVQYRPEGGLLELSDSRYCILSSNLDLANLDFQYFSKFRYENNFTRINSLTGINGSHIGVSYILDSEKFAFSSETWQSSLLNFKVNNSTSTLGNKILCSNLQSNNTSTWKTKYPPHYYAYKASIYDELDPQRALESSNLNFYLRTSAQYTSLNSCILSSYISTDHDLLKYNLVSNSINEYIKFEVVSNPIMVEFKNVVGFYGENFSHSYDLIDSPWVPVVSATSIFINYPDAPFGRYNFAIRATLSSKAGLLPSDLPVQIEFAKDKQIFFDGNPMYFKIFKNIPDSIELSVAHLSAFPAWPAKDLRNSYISWSFYPADVPAVIEGIDSNGNFIQSIEPNTPVLFSNSTSTIRVSNFGFSALTVRLSSQKYSQVLETSATAYLDPFIENKFAIGFSAPFDNIHTTRKASITAALPYKNRTFAMPLSTPVSWMWKYNFDFVPETQPIKAYVGPNRVPYEFGTEGLSQDLSALYLEITPKESDVIPPINSVKAFMVTRNKDPFVSGSFEFFVDDFPSRRLLNTDMEVYYIRPDSSLFPDTSTSRILNSYLDNFVITRPNDGTNFYLISAHEMFGELEEDTTFVWNLSDNYYGQHPLIETTYAQIQRDPLFLDLNDENVTETTVTLSALSAWPILWRSLNILRNVDFPIIPVHSIYTTITINTPSPSEFYKKLQIISYPEFTWNDSQKVTILNQNNYTLAQYTTAYLNKKSNSVGFYLSANKNIFNQYDYYISSEVLFLSSLSSYHGYLDIPYSEEFSSVSGLQITLTAFGVDYPSNYPIHYIKPESTSLNSPLCSYVFPITSQTIPRFEPAPTEFFKNPQTVSYNISAAFNFSLPQTSISLNSTRQLTIEQSLSTIPGNSPIRPELQTGTITYAISSRFWSKTTQVPTLSGLFKAFNLSIGDPYEVGFLSNLEISTLKFKPLYTEYNAKIPADTFSEYSLEEYSGPRDLWDSIPIKEFLDHTDWLTIETFATGAPVNAYLSDFIAITGQKIFLQFLPVNETDSVKISFYRVFFGETGAFELVTKEEKAIYSYSKPGSYYISYEVQYNDGSFSFHRYPTPIRIKKEWDSYNQDDIRTLSELTLSLPYSLGQIEIQPNEWGEADIFNTSISRLYENLKYLQSNAQTINTDFPTLIFGWLGCDKNNLADGIRWYSLNFDHPSNPGLKIYTDATRASNSKGSTYFEHISSITATDKYLYVLQDFENYTDLKLRVFSLEDGYKGSEIIFYNQIDLQEEFILPIKIETIDDKNLFILDKARNKVVKIDLDFSERIFNISNSVGTFGSREDTGKLNSPSDLLILKDRIYVSDYGNRCIKEYSLDLNWLSTYYVENFEVDRPQRVSSQVEGLIYVLTENFKVYVLEQNNSEPLAVFSLSEIYSEFDLLNKEPLPEVAGFTTDESGEFFYVAVKQLFNKIFKYSATGLYIGMMELYTVDNFDFKDFIKSKNKYLFAASDRAIVKIQDVVDLFKIGGGLPYKQWSLDQILLKRNEFASDLTYNRCLNRLTQNIKMFRDNLNGKFVKISEQTSSGVVTYFTITPISTEEQPLFDIDIETDNSLVGVNELHIPQVLNREFKKIYDALMSLKLFLDIAELSLPALRVESTGVSILCESDFCWSWKATAGYNLRFPAIRICNVNPITYRELRSNFPISYAPTTTWSMASSDCCTKPEHLK